MAIAESSFEEPLIQLRRQIEELEGYPEGARHEKELARLRRELEQRTTEIYRDLTPWQTTLVARHTDRPYTLDYVERLTSDWIELHGDRAFGDDPSIVAGFARYHGRTVAIIGHQKGRDTQARIRRNFGQSRPEGYRKALRVMKLAERFGRPVLTFVDTPGAFPGRGAEERGQAEAIARNLIEMAALRVPIITIVTGEGGSGGALALGVGNRVFILQHAIYSVISPEGCAAILWNDQEQREEAARAMRLGAADLLDKDIVDGIIPEPIGGAHADPEAAARYLDRVLQPALLELERLSAEQLVQQRYERFRGLGVFEVR